MQSSTAGATGLGGSMVLWAAGPSSAQHSCNVTPEPGSAWAITATGGEGCN